MVPHLGHTELMVVVVAAGVYMQVLVKPQRCKHENIHCLVCEWIYLHGVSLGLTFAGRDALKPLVINIIVVGTSAVLKPSTARSATTDPTGFPECAALWTR